MDLKDFNMRSVDDLRAIEENCASEIRVFIGSKLDRRENIELTGLLHRYAVSIEARAAKELQVYLAKVARGLGIEE